MLVLCSWNVYKKYRYFKKQTLGHLLIRYQDTINPIFIRFNMTLFRKARFPSHHFFPSWETRYCWPGMVAHTCNPSTLGGQGGQITSGQEIETILVNIISRNSISTKNTKNELGMVARACNPSHSGGRGRRIACSQEAEVAVSQESCHCTPAWLTRAKLRLKKIKNNNKLK